MAASERRSLTVGWNAMGQIVLGWLVWGSALLGVGLLLRRLWTPRGLRPAGLLVTFWTGLCGMIFLLQIWHLLWPVDLTATIVLLALGGLGLVLGRRELAMMLGEEALRRPVVLVAALAAGMWLANRGLGPNCCYDSGVYHIQYVEWAKAYPIIPGLGNLHCRLGHSNAILLVAAAMDHFPAPGRASHFMYPLLVLSLWLAMIGAAGRLIRRGRAGDAGAVFYLLFAFVLLEWTLRESFFSSFHTDLAGMILLLVATGVLLQFLRGLHESSPGQVRADLVTMAVFAGAMIAIKISMGVAAVALGATAFVAAWVALGDPAGRAAMGGPACRPVRSLLATTVWMALAGLAFVAPYVARNAIQTGYPLYPSGAFALNVDWKMPDARRDWQYRQIANWSRAEVQGAVLPPVPENWFPGWLERFLARKLLLVLPLVLTAGAVVLTLAVGHRGEQRLPRRCWLAVAPLAASLAIWFVMAPDPRYGGMALLWALAAVTVSLAAARSLSRAPAWAVRLAAAAYVAAAFFPIIVLSPLDKAEMENRPVLAAVVDEILMPPGEDGGFHRPPSFPSTSYTTPSGLTVTIPVLRKEKWVRVDVGGGMFFWGTEHEKETELYYVPIPSTPYPSPHLALRKAGDLRSGFRFVPLPPGADEQHP